MMTDLLRKKHSKYHTQIFFVVFGLILSLVFYMIKNYIGLLFISFVFCIVIYPLYRFINQWISKPKWVATPFSVILSLALVIVPTTLFIQSMVAQVIEAIGWIQNSYSQTNWQEWLSGINQTLVKIPLIKAQIDQETIIQTLSGLLVLLRNSLVNSIWMVGNTSIDFVVNFFVMVILVFFILPNISKLKNYLISISPLSVEATLQYFRRSHAMLMDTIKGTFIIGIVQGAIGGAFLAIVGVPAPVFLAFLMMILSILPIVGTAMVTVPLAIYYAATGHWVVGLLIILWQMLVVNSVDNILRPLLVSKDANLHPALMLVAVLTGINTFGFVGLLYGPLIMVILVTTVEVYRNEYR